MFDFYQKRKLRSWLFSPSVRLILLGLAVLVAVSAYHRYTIAKDMAERRAEAEARVEALKSRKASLQEEVDYLQDEKGIEAELRRQFDVVLPGEEVVVIVEEETATETIPLPPKEEAEWYEFWR